MAPIPQINPQRWTRDKEPPEYYLPREWYELEYNGRTLKYTLDIVGAKQPLPSGYPLYVGLHGGGTSEGKDAKGDKIDTGPAMNDKEWWFMWKRWYRYPMNDLFEKINKDITATNVDRAAVYVTLRGISAGIRLPRHPRTDTYDLHSQPESYTLLEQLIAHLLKLSPSEIDQSQTAKLFKDWIAQTPTLKNFIDPNKVYLLGFSAGGNGAFQLGARISDRFAAVVAAAGHPEDTRFHNMANLPILLQVGEDDCHGDTTDDTSWEAKQKNGFQRTAVYLEMANKPLDTLQKLQQDAKHPGLYEHTCQVIKNTRVKDQDPHEYWSESPRIFNEEQQILKPKMFDEWLKLYDPTPKIPETALAHPTFDDIEKYYSQAIVSPIPWLNGRVRDPIPRVVVWDLLCRPTEIDRVSPDVAWEEKRFSYWLYLRRTKDQSEALRKALDHDGADYQPEQAWINRDENAVHILHPNDYIGFLLKPSMLNFQDIKVYAGSDTFSLITLEPKQAIRDATLAARGDVELQFDAMFYLSRDKDGSWLPQSAETLEG